MEKKVNVKETQECMLETFKEFKKICDENNIKYSGMYGTGIGAIRENGFIPWDDDMDVGVEYKYFPKLIEAVKKNPHLVFERGRDAQYRSFLKIYDNRFDMTRYGGRPIRSVFIDVFQMFENPVRWKHKKWYKFLEFISHVKNWSFTETKGDEGVGVAIGYLIMKILVSWIPKGSLRWHHYNKTNKFVEYEAGKKGYAYIFRGDFSYPINVTKYKEYKFEDTKMMVVANFAKDLKDEYKGDIMIRPENGGKPEHGLSIKRKRK